MAWRRGTRLGTALLVALAATVSGDAPAQAAGAHAFERATLRIVGEGAKPTGSGLYRVNPAVGPRLLTHGPDPAPPTPAAARAADANVAAAGVERQPACATDFYQRILYAHVAGTPDRLAGVQEQIRAGVRRMDGLLNQDSLASGGPTADYKLWCDAAGEIAIASFTAASPSFADVVAGARAAGYRSSVADFLIYFDGDFGGSCGIASYNSDERLVAGNVNNEGGGYGIVYLPCWDNETAMHESGHLMGAVQYGAPNSTGSGGHCYEELDVMCYSPDGGDLHQDGSVERCADAVRFDCNFDDYFDSAPEPGEYLESHWNLGSPLNRMIAFDGATEAIAGGDEQASLGTGGKKSAVVGAAGDWRYFSFKAKRHSRLLRLRVFGAAGAELALFVRHGHKPTRNLYRCRAVVHDRHASCRLPRPERGRWYAGVRTRGGMPGSGYKISVRNKAG
jgi:hypothetical protein